MRLLVALVFSGMIGAGCRFFDIPVPSPPIVPGALLVLAMTTGYSGVDRWMAKRAPPAITTHLCGGPTGSTVASDLHLARPPS